MWFWSGTHRFHVVDGHTREDNNNDGQWNFITQVLTLQPNKKYRLKMVFLRKTVSVWVNNKVACANFPREDRQVFKNVQVYVGDPWFYPAHATVENLYYKSPPGGMSLFFTMVLMVYAATLRM